MIYRRTFGTTMYLTESPSISGLRSSTTVGIAQDDMQSRAMSAARSSILVTKPREWDISMAMVATKTSEPDNFLISESSET